MTEHRHVVDDVTREVHAEVEMERAVGESSPLALWTGVLLAPLAVMGNIEAGYSLAPLICQDWPRSMAHLVTAMMLLLAVASGLLAHRNWSAGGRDWPVDAGTPLERSRFLGALGVMFSALCILLILAQWLAVVMLRPCQ